MGRSTRSQFPTGLGKQVNRSMVGPPQAIDVHYRTPVGPSRKAFGQTVLAEDLLSTGAKQRFHVHRGREPVAFKELDREAFRATFAFLNSRLEERATVDW